MKRIKIKGNDLRKIGLKDHKLITIALAVLAKHYKRASRNQQLKAIKAVLEDPVSFKEDSVFGALAQAFEPTELEEVELKPDSEFKVFGALNISESAKHQMYTAMKLPVTVDGAMMPDAHHGYGLPIGGVLATRDAIIPYGVGIDIGCRMCLSIYRDPGSVVDTRRDEFTHVLKQHTRFGLKEKFERPNPMEVLDRTLFNEIPMLKKLQMKAFQQLGTSGGGNHFVEFGQVVVREFSNELGLQPGNYLALLSHSGSRGLGANIAMHYTKLAEKQSHLPKSARKLAWLDMNSQEGQEYWLAMNLAGDYASACHDDIHRRIAKVLKLQSIKRVENHHNFAWKEKLADGSEAIVHRKGATPAGEGVLGIIPGSMTQKGYIVAGRGNHNSIQSASHGAGRVMSRGEAKRSFTKNQMKEVLKQHNVTLLGGGVDESPFAYKDLNEVMEYQNDLVKTLGSFTPKIVRMAQD